jgi:outer membrane protein OmpA-like peptidoglycan-associated protein
MRPLFTVLALAIVALTLVAPLEGQFPRRLKQAAERAAEREVTNHVERLVRDAIRCQLDDERCYRRAKDDGKEVIFVDENGEIITGEDGVPITDRDEAAQRGGGTKAARPGEGAWANYDFVPGDEILFADDFSMDQVGDFPRRFELIEGNFELIEWEGERYVRATSGGTFAIPLPKTLPDRFTMEYAVHLEHGNAYVRVTTDRAFHAPKRSYRGSAPSVEFSQAGVREVNAGPNVMSRIDPDLVRDGVAPIRIMADGEHMKMYIGEQRVANVPNAVFPRSDTLFVAVSSASLDYPILIGAVRVAGGGRDLYDRLARDGRVATQGILFASSSDHIRPESTPTLEEIGSMLQEHADLRLAIEGHTDTDGEEAFNQDLSERRAAAVKAYLVEEFDIDASRLETSGFGESRPVADNTSPEGKQQNRRVELVRL